MIDWYASLICHSHYAITLPKAAPYAPRAAIIIIAAGSATCRHWRAHMRWLLRWPLLFFFSYQSLFWHLMLAFCCLLFMFALLQPIVILLLFCLPCHYWFCWLLRHWCHFAIRHMPYFSGWLRHYALSLLAITPFFSRYIVSCLHNISPMESRYYWWLYWCH